VKSPDGTTVPSWKDAAAAPRHENPPGGGLRADVCVVGAGIAGLSTAYLLAREGKRVIVLDEGPVGAGQTERTTAHLASALDDRFYEVEHLHGVAGSRAGYEGNAAGIDLIERVAREENIDCDFARLDGYLFPLPSDPPDELDRELAAARRAGFADAQKHDAVHLAGCATGGPCLRFPRQARFHPVKYLYGLAAAFERRGGTIYTGCRVTNVNGADPKKGTPCEAEVDGGAIRVAADAVVVATNTPAPINDWMGIYTKQAAYRTYVVAMRVPRGAVADVLWWDNGDPYHYVRLEAAAPGTAGRDGGDDLLIVGGEDHKVGQMPASDPFEQLERWARQTFPAAGEVVRRWSGQVQEPADHLAYIGRAPTAGENVFVATGDSGQGITHGSLAGLIITDLILGRTNPWAAAYDPSRKTLDRDFVKENANTLAQYADWVTGGDVKSADQIPPGEGAVLREGLSKVAVYRDDAGQVHRCSAACTHLQCVVQWNRVEKSWDCPCHGSRFDARGRVLMGPAVDDLKRLE
jgi:glycine/D-amino acid oxidase-like deaminating enzyme/nitrite reductase/ring-hydroxylating ferredoxin subunit